MKSRIFKTLFLPFFSAVLLILAFPQTDVWVLSWVGLIPLLFALDGKSAKKSFGLAYLTGLVFFWGTLYWFVHVTWIGAFFLIAYLALYFGLFGLGHRWLMSTPPLCERGGRGEFFIGIWRPFALAALWVCLEYLRGHLFSGFDWASLAHSQYQNLWMIQIADITGVYGISFLIVLVNVTLKDVWVCFCRGNPAFSGAGARCAPTGIVYCVVLLCCVLGYGWFRLKDIAKDAGDSWRIAVVQANIAQDLKSSSAEWPDNFDRHVRLTFDAAEEKPDLIIWPETSLPGYMWEDDVFLEEIKTVVRGLGIPLLLGAVTERDGKYFNSALLISAAGEVSGQYDKIHLVPFGEYVPFRKFFPRKIVEWIPVEDFSSGTNFRIFSVDNKDKTLRLSAMICFEDTLAHLARRFASAGAELLVNITNDGWFKDTKAPFLHLQAAAFRTVENRRQLVRAANTGVSCAIDASGKITDTIRDSRGKAVDVDGWKIFNVTPYQEKTFYMKYGDVFLYICFGILAWSFLSSGRRRNA